MEYSDVNVFGFLCSILFLLLEELDQFISPLKHKSAVTTHLSFYQRIPRRPGGETPTSWSLPRRLYFIVGYVCVFLVRMCLILATFHLCGYFLVIHPWAPRGS